MTKSQKVDAMSDILYKERKIRRVKKESVATQRRLKNKDKPEKKRGVKHGK